VFVEQELAATLYAGGIEKAKRRKLEDLLSLGVEERLITKE
jgi:hypothetical protein